MAYHADKGICFERTLDGGVRIFRRQHDDTRERPVGNSETTIVELTASEWATVVAAVSQRGTEYPGSHAEILELHQRD